MSYLQPGVVVLVTGASGGIGFEIAAQAAEAGAIVGVHGATAQSVARTLERLEQRVPAARFIGAPGDFLQPGAIEAVVETVATEGGRLDAVIHCAIAGAAGTTGPFGKTNPQNFGLLAQSVLGVYQQLCFASLPHLVRNGGTIVGFASDAGRFAAPRQSLIGAAFGGIIAFVRNLAAEVARDGVRVHCISPSFVVDTPVFDVFASVGDRGIRARERAGLGLPAPKDIAPMVLFLCGSGAEKITGQIISINGGLNA